MAEYSVLLIEDSPMYATFVEAYLQAADDADFRVDKRETLADGMARMSEGDVDVVLLDLTLPDSDGVQTFRTFRTAWPEAPVVVLTGLDDRDAAMSAMSLGAQDFLIKGRGDSSALSRSIVYAVERAAIAKE